MKIVEIEVDNQLTRNFSKMLENAAALIKADDAHDFVGKPATLTNLRRAIDELANGTLTIGTAVRS